MNFNTVNLYRIFQALIHRMELKLCAVYRVNVDMGNLVTKQGLNTKCFIQSHNVTPHQNHRLFVTQHSFTVF